MGIDADTLAKVVSEITPLVGARIQRIDVIDDGEISVELRIPGRTLCLLVCTRRGVERVHLIPRRPPKRVDGGGLQGLLRKRFEGRPLFGLVAEGRRLRVEAGEWIWIADLGGGFSFEARLPGPALDPGLPIPTSFPINEEVERRYGGAAEKIDAARLRDSVLAPLRQRLKKQRRVLGKLEGDRARLDELGRSGRFGELLKGHLHAVPRGAAELTVEDWETGEPLTIPLEPSLDAKANLAKLFARSKKAERGRPIVEARRKVIAAEVARLEAEIAEVLAAPLESLSSPAAPALGVPPASGARSGQQIQRERASGGGGRAADALGVPPASGARSGQQIQRERASGGGGRAADALGVPPASGARSGQQIERHARRFQTADGTEVWVGKGAEGNDRLTFGFGRGHDLWLHARGVPGAHVLLRLDRGKSATENALVDAAHLAVHFSSAKGESHADVIYVEARYVKKPKRSPPGQVVLSREKTLRLRVEPERLRRLLG